jgi:DNA mismatch repair protein MutS
LRSAPLSHLLERLTVAFQSILFEHKEHRAEGCEEPAFFGDLHLDQVLSSMIAGREEYELAPFFYCALRDVEAVHYRHHVLQDLEREPVRDAVGQFAHGMHQVRQCHVLVENLYHRLQKQRWYLESISVYCDAVNSFSEQLTSLTLGSRGLAGLRKYLAAYVGSQRFESLSRETRELKDELAAVTYAVHLKGNRVRVSRYDGEADMSEEVDRAFAKFKRGVVKNYRIRFGESAAMNHVEERILELVAKLHPETFGKLAAYEERHAHYLDDTIGRFDREVQLYLAYLEYIEPLKAAGLFFTYPRVSAGSKEERVDDSFDLALARKLIDETATVVCNDFYLSDPERILVVTGPNNGGKTTFARTYGQLHYLASLGLPVPGRDARLFLPDQIFTHFEREEDVETLRGKFEDELFRIREILLQATSDSVLVMNESFGSTTLHDALLVGSEVMQQIIAREALCVFVTFVDELASLSESTVSMISMVMPEDPAVRTYKVVRKPADGLAYAAAIAEKYGLTYQTLRRRIAR